jgi:hypothetical protein
MVIELVPEGGFFKYHIEPYTEVLNPSVIFVKLVLLVLSTILLTEWEPEFIFAPITSMVLDWLLTVKLTVWLETGLLLLSYSVVWSTVTVLYPDDPVAAVLKMRSPEPPEPVPFDASNVRLLP